MKVRDFGPVILILLLTAGGFVASEPEKKANPSPEKVNTKESPYIAPSER